MATEKKSKKKQIKPIPTFVAAVLIILALAAMACFVFYVVKPPKTGEGGGDYIGNQDFGAQSDSEHNLQLGGLKNHLSEAEVHDTVAFGRFEQDNNAENGKEDIEWIVLFKNENEALLISRYALDTVKYNNLREECSFENSDLNKYLNGEFYDIAFNDEEKQMISEKENEGKVSLLSKEQAVEYLSVNEDHVDSAEITAYAQTKGARTRNSFCWWWLKDSGNTENSAIYVHFDGTIQENGFAFDYGEVAVRPIISVKIG